MKRLNPVFYLMLALVLAVSLVAAGCGGSKTPQAKEPQKRESITIAIPNEPSTMDVQFPDDGNMRLVTENVVEGLLAMDGKTLKPVLRVALGSFAPDRS